LKTPFDGLSQPEPVCNCLLLYVLIIHLLELLVWGGSSGVGMYAIKLATLAGYRVATTCSAKNFEVVKALGASAVFDYKDPNTPEKIKTWVKEQEIGPLRKGLDCVSEKSSLLDATSCFSGGTGELATLRMSPITDASLIT
jgi:D-arabinose 1-dehydrogenase-like Zn-dependent alcohol dehydrogenase